MSKFNRFTILYSLITLMSCTESPENRLEEYLNYSYLRKDEHKAYLMLSSEDKKYKSEKEYAEELQEETSFSKNFITKNKDLFDFKILSINNLNIDTVKIKVLIEKPNSEKLLESLLSLSMISDRETKISRKKIMEKRLEELLRKPELTKLSEEREYTLIRENGDYAVFLNIGQSYKKLEIENMISKLEIAAEDKIRKVDYLGALDIYKKIQSVYPESGIEYRIDEMNSILEHTTTLNREIKLGNLKITPLSIELKKPNIYKKNWVGIQPIITSTQEPCMMLTFEITNIGDGEVFEFFEANRFKKKNSIRDNFGNEMKEYFLDYDILNVEGNNLKPIKPGEKRNITVICESAISPKASRFLWKMDLLTDNRKTPSNLYISFTRSEIKSDL